MALELEIVTPKGRALATPCEEVNVPGIDGEFGVLPGHLPTLSGVRAGIVQWREGTVWKRCAVGAGFCEVTGAPDDKVLIITAEYTQREAVDPVVVRGELKDIQVDIQKVEAIASDPTTEAGRSAAGRLRELIERENFLAAELELYGDPAPPTMRPYEEYGPSGIDETAGNEPPAS
jgi:F-type H+-transporting ATPase subunit epsilon